MFLVFLIMLAKNINQNQWNNCIISDMRYYSARDQHLFVQIEYFILLRFLDNSHWKLFYDRNEHANFSTKKQKTIDHIIKLSSSVIQEQDSYKMEI